MVIIDQDAICEHIARGKSLAAYCRDNSVSYTSVMLALRGDEDFQQNYTHAREAAADFHVDEVIEIADTEEDPAKARVRVDARKWVAAKMKPKKYGDKLTNEHTGVDGGPIAITRIERVLIGNEEKPLVIEHE